MPETKPVLGGPLAGIRILDLTQFQNGPSATGTLADNGADVIKLEPPSGDGIRYVAAPGAVWPQESINRGKRSITLDLKNEHAHSVMERLVKWADVVAENFRPGIMDKLGFGYAQCQKWNPRIIYAANSGYGPVGEWAHRPSYDGIAQGFSGAMHGQGNGPSHEPKEIAFAFADEVGAMNFSFAITAALLARERTGKGQLLETSQTGAALGFQKFSYHMATYYGRVVPQSFDHGLPPWGHYVMQQKQKCSDGKWIVVQAQLPAQMVRMVTQVLKRPDLLTARVKKVWPNLSEEESKWFAGECRLEWAKKPQQDWIDECLAADVPCAPVNFYTDLADPETSAGRHMRDNGYVRQVQHRDWGEITLVGNPNVFHGTPNNLPSTTESWHAPYLGEHTAEILEKELGFSTAEVGKMQQSATKPIGPYVEENARKRRERTKEHFNKAPPVAKL